MSPLLLKKGMPIIDETPFIDAKNVSHHINIYYRYSSLPKNCPYLELFWSAFFPDFPAFFCIPAFLHSVRMRENEGKMRTRITPNIDTFDAVHDISKYQFKALLEGLKQCVKLVKVNKTITRKNH